jgi:peroxiredoxin
MRTTTALRAAFWWCPAIAAPVWGRAATFAPKLGDPLALPPVLQADLERDPAGRDYLAGRKPVLLLAFVPTVSPECVYARMMSQAFDLFFRQGLAFADGGPPIPSRPAILLVSGDDDSVVQSFVRRRGFDLHIVGDPQRECFTAAGLPVPDDPNGDAVVVLLDAQRMVRYVSTDYRGQGEKLKVLEKSLKALLDPSDAASAPPPSPGREGTKPLLREGDPAPDFGWDGAVARSISAKTLSGLRGKVVVVSFYPAPFSGLTAADVAASAAAKASRQPVFEPTPANNFELPGSVTLRLSPIQTRTLTTDEVIPPIRYALADPPAIITGTPIYGGPVTTAQPLFAPPRDVELDRRRAFTACSGQATSFDNLPNSLTSLTLESSSLQGPRPVENSKDVVVLLICTSTPALVARWTTEMGVKNNVMINDPGFRIADLYDSHNPAGYNERTVFIVDRAGMVRYVNHAYQVDDAGYAELLKKIAAIDR